MDAEFWAGAVRDFALLLAGGGLTLGGTWINGRRETRHRKEDRERQEADAAESREHEAVEFLRTRLLQVYMSVREQQLESTRDQARVDHSDVLEVETAAGLIRSAEIREPLTLALRALNSLRTPIDFGYLTVTPVQGQAQILHSALQVLTESARGDKPTAAALEQLKKFGEATRDAWDEAIKAQAAVDI